jgi:hypothetical protein
MRKPNCNCSICDKEIYRRPTQIECGKIFCSRKCCGLSQRKEKKYCKVCGKELGKDSKITCSRACSNKNRSGITYDALQINSKARRIKLLKNQLLEERGEKCQLCDYSNINILQVHHIIERHLGGSDDKENLLLICPNCHYTIHYGDSRRDNNK